MPKLSVIVPIYGVEKYLKECLDSILSQTFTDMEILLIDDGGKDECPQIIDEYAKKDSRIVAIHKSNGGYGQSCNVGLERATGEYISIIEPDDYIDPKMFEDLYNIANQYNSDIVKSGFYDNLQSKEKVCCKQVEWKDFIPEDKTFTIKEYPYFLYYHPSIWSCFYKKEFLDKHKIRFVEAPGAGWTDNPFQVQTMCLAKRINYTSKAYYYWRRVNENESDDLKDWTIPFKRSDEIHKWLDENNISDNNCLVSLYMRELVYIQIVLGKKYSKEEIVDVFSAIEKMTSRMNIDIIENSSFIKKQLKKKLILAKTNLPKFYNNLETKKLKLKLKKIRQNLFSIRWNKNEKSLTLLNKNILKIKKQNHIYKKNKYDIGIMGYWYGHNYGSILTYFALNSLLKDMDKSVLMIQNPFISKKLYLNTPKNIISNFTESHYEISEPRTFNELWQLNNICKTIMLGSDQLWAPHHFRKHKNAFFLNFANKNIKKIACGVSFGKDTYNITAWEKKKIKFFLKRFQKISVREKSGQEILKKMFNTESDIILDPVFLCNPKYYRNLIKEEDINTEKNTVLAYILDPDNEKRELILNISKNLNKLNINILDYPPTNFARNKAKLNLENTKNTMSIQSFLSYYLNCDFVVTDSFHGTCMAIIFKKPFIAIANKARGITRFESILSTLGLKDRLVYDAKDAIDSPLLSRSIDYDKVFEILRDEKKRSLKWIKNALETPINPKKFDLIDTLFFIKKINIFYNYLRYSILEKILSKTRSSIILKKDDYKK